MINVNIAALAYNPNEWQRPTEIIPERFDTTNELSKTPDGKKRHNCSWVPFHGGSRVCFGKTLAETELKVLAVYMTQKFEFEFEDPAHMTKMPMAHID